MKSLFSGTPDFLTKVNLSYFKTRYPTTSQAIPFNRKNKKPASPTLRSQDLFLSTNALILLMILSAFKDNKNTMKKNLLLGDIDHLWLLNESHCLRNQMLNLSELRKKELETLAWNM